MCSYIGQFGTKSQERRQSLLSQVLHLKPVVGVERDSIESTRWFVYHGR